MNAAEAARHYEIQELRIAEMIQRFLADDRLFEATQRIVLAGDSEEAARMVAESPGDAAEMLYQYSVILVAIAGQHCAAEIIRRKRQSDTDRQ